jgi:DASS family divalent anion:Na+ symporter
MGVFIEGDERAWERPAMSSSPAGRASGQAALTRLGAFALAVALWFIPPPHGLTLEAWRLFAIFFASIASVVIGAFPMLTASVFAAAGAVMTGLLTPDQAYAGFANSTILLIVVAFLVARAVVKCGLGQRLGHFVVGLFGRSTLGLCYSIFLVDAVIAPAFPSNTARGGVLYPLVVGVAEAGGASPDNPGRRRLGGYLMFSGMVSLSLSSTLWFTAMAANPLGAELARSAGVQMSFVSWLIASSVPTLVAMLVLPWLLLRIMSPEVTSTPDAPAAAKRALAALGPLSRDERTVTLTFVGMVALWACAGFIGLDSTAVAFLGLGVLLATGVLTGGDIAKEGDVLATFIWFAVLFTLSGQLNEMGFMGYLGHRLAGALGGFGPIPVYLILVLAYVLLHYLFVSQTAHVLALFAVFLEVGVKLGVPAAPLAFMLLFASNFFSVITPQGSSANLLFTGSGYLSQGELYRLGAITTAISLVIYLVVATPWLMFVAR